MLQTTYNGLTEDLKLFFYKQTTTLTTKEILKSLHARSSQRRLDPGMETPEGFFQVRNQKEYQNVVIISFVHLEKINNSCFIHKSVAQN